MKKTTAINRDCERQVVKAPRHEISAAAQQTKGHTQQASADIAGMTFKMLIMTYSTDKCLGCSLSS